MTDAKVIGILVILHKLHFKSSFDRSKEMIAFYRIGILGTLVSERLKTALIRSKTTGLRFEKSEYIE